MFCEYNTLTLLLYTASPSVEIAPAFAFATIIAKSGAHQLDARGPLNQLRTPALGLCAHLKSSQSEIQGNLYPHREGA